MGVYPSMLCALAHEEDAAAQIACCLERAGFVPDPQRMSSSSPAHNGGQVVVGCHLTASIVHRGLGGVGVPLDQRTPAVDTVDWALGLSYSDPKASELTMFGSGIWKWRGAWC